MAKDKEKSPFAEPSPYERILGVRGDQIRERIHRHGDADESELLTSRDLFGDIIEELHDRPGSQESKPSTSEGSVTPAERTKPQFRPRPEAQKSSELVSTPRSDTNPSEGKRDTEAGYELLDLAYSALLRDSELHQDLEGLRDAAPTDVAKNIADYGQYLLLDRVAMGGMAEVFRAKRKGVEGFEKIVAVKRILPHLSDNKDFVEMFIDEAKMVAGLSHPNIAQIFDLGKIEDTYYIAMEYVDGKDLRAILERARRQERTIPVELAGLIAARVGSALAYAHRQKDDEGRELRIVHRDVSPPNILISTEGEVKLVDFGIAKAAIKATHTDSGSLRGKLLYMSPEQAWGRPIDKRSDIFSLGLVLFEMLTGRCLFTGDSEMSILERVREARLISPSAINPAVPIELEAVITRALKKDPELRYQDASDMLRDLDSYLRRRSAVGAAELARLVRELFAETA